MKSIAEIVLEKLPGADFDTENGVITTWRSKNIPRPDDVQVEAWRQETVKQLAATLYQRKREAEYPPVGDQLDRICKVLKSLSQQGVSLGPDGDALLAQVDAVKAKYPKPE